ncbi:MAG TPA: SWIM zinc finger family protein [Candidatus Bathyarchaeia archaeon]|nr:SWIM zinc finger family protein [Candidatus Bathyarchaeia archaeon]
MLQKELNQEQVMQLGEQILRSMEGPVLERGYEYFSQGLVFNIQVKPDGIITSAVQGTQVYQVEIHMESFPDSSCSCPYPSYCKHIAATFFQIYSVFANPKHFLQEAQQPRSEAFSASILYPQGKPPAQARYQHLPSSVSSLTEQSTIDEWWQFLRNWTRNLSTDMEKHRLYTELRNNYERAQSASRLWQKDRAHLFSIHAILHHLQKLDEYGQHMRIVPSSPSSQDFARTVNRFMEELETALFYMDKSQVASADLDHTLKACSQMGNETSVMNWAAVTHVLWWYLLDDPQNEEAIAQDLLEKLGDAKLSPQQKAKVELLYTHFAIRAGKDELALSIWEQHIHLALFSFLFYLKVIARNEDWERLLLWFDRLPLFIKKMDGQEYRLAAAIWRHTLDMTGRSAEWITCLKGMLPRSFQEYAAFLYEDGNMKLWLDVHFSMGTPYPELAEHSKRLEEIDPRLLLPLYIREINRLIHTRTRTAYKEAVKLLKKVRTCFQQIDQQRRWDTYIEQLAGKHKRLRTFQEELRRGNLFS